jgi:hypothetical protein
MNTDVVNFDIATTKAEAWCDCVSDFGPVPSCENCKGTGRDPVKWLARFLGPAQPQPAESK